MKRQADALLTHLREFIAQPDYPTLVLRGQDSDMILPNRALAGLDPQDEANYYVVFPQPCVQAAAYVDIIATTLTTQLEVLNTEREARKLASIPVFPPAVTDRRYPAASRLRAAIEHCGTHLPSEAPIVWGLLPGTLADLQGYRSLIEPLLAPQSVEPWMERHRFIVRDLPPSFPIAAALKQADNDRVLVMDVDFSNERFVQDLVETVSNSRQSPESRMHAFFQLGAFDMALRRYPQALEKYGVCFSFFEARKDPLMPAMCLLGAADTAGHAGATEASFRSYQQALALGVEQQNLAIIQQATYGAGTMALELERYKEAAGYLKHADEAAAKMHNPYAKCDALEKRGIAAWRLEKLDEAFEYWVVGKDLAKQFDYHERAIAILDRMIAITQKTRLHSRTAAFQAERANLRAPSGGAGSSGR